MIRIYICEDNEQQLESISKTVKQFIDFEDSIFIFSVATTDPYTLLRKVQEDRSTGIYFLDIDLRAEINGFELAKQLRLLDPRGYIIFITTHSEMSALTFEYKVEAMDFILKDYPESIPERIRQCLKTAAANDTVLQKQCNNLISFKIDNATVYLKQDDVIFIEPDSTPHKLIIHTCYGVKRIAGSLKELENVLDKRFFRCHKSVLVNSEHILSFEKNRRILFMDNGERCPVAYRNMAMVWRILGDRGI